MKKKLAFNYPERNTFYSSDNVKEIAVTLINSSYKQLFEPPNLLNFLFIFDENLTILSHYIDRSLMLSEIKISNGMSLKKESFFEETSIIEAFNTKTNQVQKADSCDNYLSSYTNCTAPIKLNEEYIYISAFYLGSKNDIFSINTFILFTKWISSQLKYLFTKNSIENYSKRFLLPGLNELNLTECEKKVFHYVKLGHSNKKISEKLYLSENTVKVYIKTISSKLLCENRSQVAITAILLDIKELLNKY